jgi:hypothetical protein
VDRERDLSVVHLWQPPRDGGEVDREAGNEIQDPTRAEGPRRTGQRRSKGAGMSSTSARVTETSTGLVGHQADRVGDGGHAHLAGAADPLPRFAR